VSPNTHYFLETLYAVTQLGAIQVPLNYRLASEEYDYIFNDCEPRVLIADYEYAEKCETIRDAVPVEEFVGYEADRIDGEWQDYEAILSDRSTERPDRPEISEDDPATINYTSGTTGNPKGVRHAHRALLGILPKYVCGMANNNVEDNQVIYSPAEWSWVAGTYNTTFSSLFYGNPILAYEGRFDAERQFDLIESYAVTNMFLPPTAVRKMQEVEGYREYDRDSMQVVSTGGSPGSESLISWLKDTFGQAAVHTAFGQTELNGLIADCEALGVKHRPNKLGRELPGHDVEILDPETLEKIETPGEIGEIAVRYEGDPVCFKGYLNKPEATNEKLQEGWALTEDLGSFDDSEYFSFHSRKDDVILSAGYRIGPGEIENALTDHEMIIEAGVIGVPDDERGEVPKAFVETAPSQNPSEELKEALKSHVRDRLAKYEYPHHIEFVDELPKTTTGKVQRAELRKLEEF